MEKDPPGRKDLRNYSGIASLVSAAALMWLGMAGCSGEVFTGESKTNRAPEVWLSSGPVEGDTTGYQVHFYWGGWDPDGEIDHFEFVIADGDPIGFNPADTAGLDAWTATSSYDSVFRVSADVNPQPYEPNDLYTKYDRTHTLFLRGVDMQGKRSEVATRSFTAWTLAPFATITHPQGVSRSYSQVITFKWEGRDPIDSPSNFQTPDSIRYMYTRVVRPSGIYDPTFQIIDDLNDNPGRYEQLWGPWIYYRAPGDSGISTILGDDEILEINRSHIFAVQAKDEAGAVTALFRRDQNVRQFLVSFKAGPLLTVTEPFLGGFQFLGSNMRPETVELPPGVPLNLCWEGDASSYGGEIRSYRYGWDIQQLDDPTQWAVSPSPYHRCAPERTWYSGIHTFFVECVDNGGMVTLARVQISVIPFSMERNLLWVDDWPLGQTPLPNMMLPDETAHDEFWTELCSMTLDFIPDRDIYDCEENNFQPPEMRVVGKYKNIVWTYGNSPDGSLRKVIRFTPESMLGQGGELTINYISLFLAKGGHVWTNGRSDHASGGLSVIFPEPPAFPASFKFDMSASSEDTSGVNSMGYRDYCVQVVDKVVGTFRSGAEMPARRVSDDAMADAWLDTGDPVTAQYEGLPGMLELSGDVTAPGMFFDPQDRGFIYVECYDPDYWMVTRGLLSQGCFHPIYRMNSRSTRSPINNSAVALWIDRYSDVEPDTKFLPAGPARSVHFGLPLWFFERSQVDSIAGAIFEEWHILE